MAKGSQKRPKESKCRGSGAPVEGRDWVRIGGSSWLREVAEKQGKFIPREYRETSGTEITKRRIERQAEAEAQARASLKAAAAPPPPPEPEVELEPEVMEQEEAVLATEEA